MSGHVVARSYMLTDAVYRKLFRTVEYRVRVDIHASEPIPTATAVMGALNVGAEGAPEDLNLGALTENLDVLLMDEGEGSARSALDTVIDSHEGTIELLRTPDDEAARITNLCIAARSEANAMRVALGRIAAMSDDTERPEEENYHDTESAYDNGMDVAAYDAAAIARAALNGKNEFLEDVEIALDALLLAYALSAAKGDGGSVNWDDVDEAFTQAKRLRPGKYEALVRELGGEA